MVAPAPREFPSSSGGAGLRFVNGATPMTGSTLRRLLLQVGAALVVLCVYLGALHGLPKDVFWHPDEGGKFIGLRTLRWDGGLEYRVPYRGQTLDPRFEFYPGA